MILPDPDNFRNDGNIHLPKEHCWVRFGSIEMTPLAGISMDILKRIRGGMTCIANVSQNGGKRKLLISSIDNNI